MRLNRLAPLVFIAAAWLLIGETACFADQSADFLAELERLNEEYADAFRAADSERLAGFFTEDAVVIVPQTPPFEGRREIEEWADVVFDMGVRHVRIKPTEVVASGDVAYEIGRFTALSRQGELMGRGDYVALWKKEGGEWKIFRSMSTIGR